MNDIILSIINEIRDGKGLSKITILTGEENLREDLGLTSLDLAELTVKIEDETGIDIFEDGLVSTVKEIFQKLK